MFNKSLHRFWREYRGTLLFLFLIFGVRCAIADLYIVPTGSMEPNILPGDRIIANKLAYDVKVPFTDINLHHNADPQRGDIIVFKSERAQMRLIKRLIGVPGDLVELRDNVLILNGARAHYMPFSNSDTLSAAIYRNETIAGFVHGIRLQPLHASPLRNFGPVRVPAGHYWVLGDNRDNSRDSRYYGYVAHKEIIGRARVIAFSLDYEDYYLPRLDRMFKSLL